jgi:tRNA threonylcarbamoyladenosine biosynthesis protein TsaE
MSETLLPTENDARAWGRLRGETLVAGEVVALVGALGAGKTQVVKGLAAGLGYAGEVTSPTFPLVHEYVGGRLPIFHFDFYRIEAAGEVLVLGWDEYLEAGGVCVIEWADRFPALLPAHTEWWRLTEVTGGGRMVRRMTEVPGFRFQGSGSSKADSSDSSDSSDRSDRSDGHPNPEPFPK